MNEKDEIIQLKEQIEGLGNKIKQIEERNHRVEGDKLWETCWLRKMLILIFTFVFASAYLFVANTTNPFLGAIVPCVGFLLSTITIKPIKKWYLEKKNKK